jgi:hypothetical protein
LFLSNFNKPIQTNFIVLRVQTQDIAFLHRQLHGKVSFLQVNNSCPYGTCIIVTMLKTALTSLPFSKQTTHCYRANSSPLIPIRSQRSPVYTLKLSALKIRALDFREVSYLQACQSKFCLQLSSPQARYSPLTSHTH